MHGSTDSARRFAVDHADWFELVAVEPRLHMVAEPGHVFSWLIHGSERTVMLDTGLGIADVRAAIAPLATSPVIAVNSHTHFDHVGGNDRFESIAVHESGAALLSEGQDPDELAAYERLAPAMAEEWRRLVEIDRLGSFVLGPDQRVREWPISGIEAAGGWRIAPTQADILLADGAVVDLGDRSLRVMHTPGHAPDHICLLDEKEGVLFAQDQVYYGPHLVYLEESDVGDFARSARRLANELRGALRAVYVAHCLRPSVPPAFLDELANAADDVAGGEANLVPGSGLFGEPVSAADHGHFSILVPPAFDAG